MAVPFTKLTTRKWAVLTCKIDKLFSGIDIITTFSKTDSKINYKLCVEGIQFQRKINIKRNALYKNNHKKQIVLLSKIVHLFTAIVKCLKNHQAVSNFMFFPKKPFNTVQM